MKTMLPGPITRSTLLSLGVARGIAACSAQPTQPPGAPSVNRAMEAWKGRKVAEAVGLWGMPDSIAREGTLGKLAWTADNAPGKPAFPPLPGNMEWAIRCARVLMVDPSETIVEARVYGGDCSTNAEDYAPLPP